MGYVIGIDGGGTKTRLRAADGTVILGEVTGDSCNLTSNGEECVRDTLTLLFKKLIGKCSVSAEECEAVCIGAAGAGSAAIAEKLKNIVEDTFAKAAVLVTTDAMPMLQSILKEKRGAVLIAGTGSLCLAQNGELIVRTGGYGHLLGDEGSGYAAAVQMMQAVLQAYDGRAEKTVLSELLLSKMGLSNPYEIVNFVYKKTTGKKEMAAFAPLLAEAIALGDETAIRIGERAAAELAMLISCAYGKIGLRKEKLQCYYSGGFIKNTTFVREKLYGRLSGSQIELCPYEGDPVAGCVMMALHQQGESSGKDSAWEK